MTVVLGARACGVLGCRRDRHVSPTGIAYSMCIAHAEDLLRRAFADRHDLPQRDGGRVERSPQPSPVPVALQAALTASTAR